MMSKTILTVEIAVLLTIGGCGTGRFTAHKQTTEPMVAHNVYFTLNDGSDAAKSRLTDACYKHLRDHNGVVFFAAGPLAEELNRPVNVRDFHIGLHIVFRTRKFHDEYQTSEKHLRFIKENEDSLTKVRVFDTLVR
jgi:hypothetical protein